MAFFVSVSSSCYPIEKIIIILQNCGYLKYLPLAECEIIVTGLHKINRCIQCSQDYTEHKMNRCYSRIFAYKLLIKDQYGAFKDRWSMCQYSLTADWFWFNPSAFSQWNHVFHLNVQHSWSSRSRLSQQVASFNVIASVVSYSSVSVKLLTKDILRGCTHDTHRRRRLRLESNC